jgi:hypothetical protein
VGEGARVQAMAEAVTNVLGRAVQRVAAIEVAEGVEDYLERKDFAACCRLRGEKGVAGVAVPALEGLVCVVPLPCPGDPGTGAVEAALKVRADEGSVGESAA